MNARFATLCLFACAGLIGGASVLAQPVYYEGEDREHYVGNARLSGQRHAV